MIGTIVNTCTIIAGSLLGSLLNRGIKEKYKQAVPDFAKGPVVEIKNVEVIPEYKFDIKL